MKRITVVFAVLLIACVASSEPLYEVEQCIAASCIEESKCLDRKPLRTCPAKGDVCCQHIPEEAKYRCAHYGGECKSEQCGVVVRKPEAKDCPKGTTCCVLV